MSYVLLHNTHRELREFISTDMGGGNMKGSIVVLMTADECLFFFLFKQAAE